MAPAAADAASASTARCSLARGGGIGSINHVRLRSRTQNNEEYMLTFIINTDDTAISPSHSADQTVPSAGHAATHGRVLSHAGAAVLPALAELPCLCEAVGLELGFVLLVHWSLVLVWDDLIRSVDGM